MRPDLLVRKTAALSRPPAVCLLEILGMHTQLARKPIRGSRKSITPAVPFPESDESRCSPDVAAGRDYLWPAIRVLLESYSLVSPCLAGISFAICRLRKTYS